MRRFALWVAALTATGTLTVIGSAPASASTRHKASVAHSVTPHTPLLETIYYYDFALNSYSFCEVDTLVATNKTGAGGAFSSDKGDVGTWTKSSGGYRFKFTGSTGALPAGSVIAFKTDPSAGRDVGIDVSDGISYSPFYIEGGDNVLGVGTC